MSRASGVRARQKAQTRRQLLDAALALVEHHDYGQIQISDITEAAGVAKGTFYVHFESKEALFDELRREFNEGFAALALDCWRQHAPDLDAFVAALAPCFLDYWATHASFVRAYAQRMAFGAAFEQLRDGINPEIRSVLMQVVSERPAAIPDEDVGLVMQGILSLWLRFGLQCLDDAPDVRQRHAKLLAAMTRGCLQAVRAQPV